jgi:hypothetical protein
VKLVDLPLRFDFMPKPQKVGQTNHVLLFFVGAFFNIYNHSFYKFKATSLTILEAPLLLKQITLLPR